MIVDEFDLLRDGEARELTANLLKSLHDHAINVTVLLIGVAENVDELIIDHRSLRRVLSLIKLERISTIDLKKILDSRLRVTPLEISEDACSEILALSCGLPYYVQTLGRHAVQNALKYQRLQITTEDVTTAIDNFIFESGQSFADDYQRATESRQESNIFREVILASALALSDASGIFKSPEVAKTLDLIAPGQGYHHARVQQYLAQFVSERRGSILIRSGLKPDYRYRFSDALMQPFIVMRAIKDGMIDKELRHRLFHWGVAGTDATPFETIIPTVSEAAGGEIPATEEAGGEASALSESRLARSKLGLHPGDGSVSGAVRGGSETATLAPRTRERSWRLFRR